MTKNAKKKKKHSKVNSAANKNTKTEKYQSKCKLVKKSARERNGDSNIKTP